MTQFAANFLVAVICMERHHPNFTNRISQKMRLPSFVAVVLDFGVAVITGVVSSVVIVTEAE